MQEMVNDREKTDWKKVIYFDYGIESERRVCLNNIIYAYRPFTPD